MTRFKETTFIGMTARMAAGMGCALQVIAGRVPIPRRASRRRARYRRSGRVVLAAILALVVAAPALAADPNVASPAPQPSPAPLGPSSLATSGANVLIYGPTSGGYADSTPGVNVTVWDEATWASKSTADFAAFDAIVFGDEPICFTDPSHWATAVADRQVWTAAITGNVIINGTDPDYHGKSQLVQQSVQFAASDGLPGPGLYVSLSCAYHSASAIVPVDLLGALGEFTVTGVQNCPNDAHKVAEHPTLAGIDDAYLSNWSCSTHDIFNSWPVGYQPLAIIQDAQPVPSVFRYTATDGEQGHVYMLARGAASSCVATDQDTDADCLPNSVELAAPPTGTGTDPNNADTDGDGLLDSWEVTGVQGAGFHLPTGDATRDEVFGDYGPPGMSAWDCASQSGVVDASRHVIDNFVCMNQPPDPNHKDVFIEIDWQDCRKGDYACPEVLFFGVSLPGLSQPDDTHHAPDVYALADLVATFAAAPVTNPDGRAGVDLHIVVDEGIPHTPNCDRGTVDRTYFGTKTQRGNPAVLAARAQAVRYVWSGHSSTRDSDDPAGCPLPTNFLEQGFDGAPLADYDESPFGDSNVDGRDVILTLGPLWSCSSVIGSRSGPLAFGLLGPCFRENNLIFSPDGITIGPVDPGIFPARVPSGGGERRQAYPLDLVMGMHEHDGIRQLWSRGLMHLLGHSLGLADETAVNNVPAPPGREQDASRAPLVPLAPDGFDSWVGVRYAPLDASGNPLGRQEGLANYGELALGAGGSDSDPDNDGVLEDADNCPGIWNPDQANEDGPLGDAFGDLVTNPGDACDQDIDGDGQINSTFGALGSLAQAPDSGSGTLAADQTTYDPLPFDTDNDGTDNGADPDDDNDGVVDANDNCRLMPNPDQLNRDGDGPGNACDLDADGDGVANTLEQAVGSDPLDPASTPEYVELGDSCANGINDDGLGGVDGADPGCLDGDADGIADGDDNCPTTGNPTQRDTDSDGLGDACDLVVRIDWVRFANLPAVNNGTEFYWSATRAGTFSVRSGGTDCSSGTVIGSGSYDPGAYDPSLGEQPASALAIVPSAALVAGANVERVCVTAGSAVAAATTTITVGTDATPPSSQAGPLDPAYATDTVDVPYTASDDLTGVDHVELYWRYRATPSGTWSAWTLGASSTSSPITFEFGSGAGYYEFYSIAIDGAGNREAAPATADAATQHVGVTGVGKAWGSNSQGQLGNGTTANSSTPVDVSALSGIAALDAGAEHSLAAKTDGTAWAWGQNANGELGDGTTTDRLTPVQVSGISGANAVACGTAHSLVQTSNGTVWSFGLNQNGQLGDGTTSQRTAPVPVSGLTGVVAISAGSDHSLALKSDGTVWAWGKNTNGQLGDGTKQKRTTPVRSGTLTGVIAIAAGGDHSLALKSDGSVWAWGYNFYGELGDGTTTNRTSPVRVTGATGVVGIAAGSNHSLAVKSDGTVWAWGNNGVGQLGDGTTTSRTTPVRSGTLTGVAKLAAGAHHSIAVKSDGTVWAWGYNLYGQVGDGTTSNRTSAVQVTAVSSIAEIAGGAFFSLAATGR